MPGLAQRPATTLQTVAEYVAIEQGAGGQQQDIGSRQRNRQQRYQGDLKLLNAYDRMSGTGVSGENIDTTLAKVEGMMRTIVAALEKQLDSLYGRRGPDIPTDITVLENMMAREGLVDSPLKAEPDEEKETDYPAGAVIGGNAMRKIAIKMAGLVFYMAAGFVLLFWKLVLCNLF